MRITVVASPFHELPPIAIGAVEKLFYQLAGAWTDAGHDVSFVCAGGGDDVRMRFVRLKKYARTGSTWTDLIWDFIYSFKAILFAPRADVLLCNTFWSPVFAPLLRWKYKKLIYGVHRYPKGQFFLYPFVHRFICVSAAVAEPLKKQVAPHRICVVVNPIDTTVFKPEPRPIVKGRVLYAGRIHPLKGLRCLSEACGRLFAEGLVKELVLVGPCEQSKGGGGEEFVNELRASAVGCPVNVTGAIPDLMELAKIERTAEVFVYPSEDARGEAFGIAPLEAMALGVPTAVSDFRCFTEFVEPEANALVFKAGDVEDLHQALKRLLTDKSLQVRLSAEAARMSRDFDVLHIAARYLRVFED